jgi:hypothetical protein
VPQIFSAINDCLYNDFAQDGQGTAACVNLGLGANLVFYYNLDEGRRQ